MDSRFAHFALPFFDAEHAALAQTIDAIAQTNAAQIDHTDTDAACKRWVAVLGEQGVLKHAVPAPYGGVREHISSRALVTARETLAFHDGLADFAFAMQGLGSGALALAGTEDFKRLWLPRVANGQAIAAFALSEPNAGSDVAAMQCKATRTTGGWLLNGEKTWISNGGIAHFYTVFARSGDAPRGTKDITAFVVPADAPGFSIADRIDVIAPHPLARLLFENCFVPDAAVLGAENEGFKLAMRTLDIFRTSVAAAALGFARRALFEALAHVKQRPMLGGVLADLQLTQAALGEMAATIDAAALLTYRAAWMRDVQGANTTREAAMAKLAATEGAQQVIDRAVQLFGGAGVQRGNVVESLYREIRALRIYEGATEVQKLIVGRELLKA
ncbi:MAG: acyl-CoA dehydrogenase family protein [Burkholderiaceae bacterium]